MLKSTTLLGIDGIGKSTILEGILNSENYKNDDFHFINSPSFYEVPNTPFENETRAFDQFSALADQAQSFELKILAMYLQVAFFGPIENALTNEKAKEVHLSFRHPVVDSLVYGEYYLKYINKEIDSALLSSLLGQMGDLGQLILNWFENQKKRLGWNCSMEELPVKYLKEIYKKPLSAQISLLEDHYQSKMPSKLILLDLEPEEAFKRLKVRVGANELHESLDSLKFLRTQYKEVLERISNNDQKIENITMVLSKDLNKDQLLKKLYELI
ncbi:MAG: thymidylate kinase [Thermoproteota archaeon]|jgi:thymidylate kinase